MKYEETECGLLYGCETWIPNEAKQRILDSFRVLVHELFPLLNNPVLKSLAENREEGRVHVQP